MGLMVDLDEVLRQIDIGKGCATVADGGSILTYLLELGQKIRALPTTYLVHCGECKYYSELCVKDGVSAEDYCSCGCRKGKEFEEEKEWMDTVAVNYIVAQSDGFQLGYAQAISDLTSNILDYWEGSDDKPQQSFLDTLVDLGENLAKRKEIAKTNMEVVSKRGYERYYHWQNSEKGEISVSVNLFTKKEAEENEDD